MAQPVGRTHGAGSGRLRATRRGRVPCRDPASKPTGASDRWLRQGGCPAAVGLDLQRDGACLLLEEALHAAARQDPAEWRTEIPYTGR